MAKKNEIKISRLLNSPVIGTKSVYVDADMHFGRTSEIVQIMHMPNGELYLKDADAKVYTLPEAGARILARKTVVA